MHRVGSIQIDTLKDIYTYNKDFLTVLWMRFTFLVVLNCFFCNDAMKDDMRMVLTSYGSSPRKLSVRHAWERKVHHWFQLQDRLTVVAFDIPLVMSRIMI